MLKEGLEGGLNKSAAMKLDSHYLRFHQAGPLHTASVGDASLTTGFVVDHDGHATRRAAIPIRPVERAADLRVSSTFPSWESSVMGLDRAFDRCAAITRQHSKTFHLSTSFLPKAKRAAVRAFYAFCRTTDDIVDVLPGDDQARQAHLDAWRQDARRTWQDQTDPVLAAWAYVRDAYDIPRRYVEELIDGCKMDLTIMRYASWDELRQYCYHVASTVGLISMHIIGLNGGDLALFERSQASAAELGIALQLTNILRDVGEDLRRDRIYLPAEDLRRYGYTEDDLRHGIIDDRFRALMRFEIDRAQVMYQRGLPSIASLSSDGRLAVGAAILLYRDILDKIVANDFDVFSQRAHLTLADKLCRLPHIAWQVSL